MRSLGSRLETAEREAQRRLAAEARLDWWALVEQAQQGDCSCDDTDFDDADALDCYHAMFGDPQIPVRRFEYDADANTRNPGP